MTTRDLDDLGRRLLEQEGAASAPETTYGFLGATCISFNEEIAYGIPGARLLCARDLVNIDVFASRDGYFADTGASFRLAAARPDRLCKDGHRAMQIGIAQVAAGKPLVGIRAAIGRFADKRGYTLILNLASHGVGRSLHEYPQEIATWPARGERRLITKGLVLTVEPFLSRGGRRADDAGDGWTLHSVPPAETVQFEHTVVATPRGATILTLPG